MAFSDRYTFGFAATVCVVCSLLVAAGAQGLRPYQELNERRDLQGSILTALGRPGLRGADIDHAYETEVRVVLVDAAGAEVTDRTLADAQQFGATPEAKQLGAEGNLSEAAWATWREGAILPVYQRVDGDRVVALAIPLQGVGLWGPVSGFLALEPDGHTVSGATFFAPKETPGLGYEIVAPAFTEQFVGKQIFATSGPAPIDVVKGDLALACRDREIHCVRGVSGATLTSNGVDLMIQAAVTAYEPYLAQVRSGGS